MGLRWPRAAVVGGALACVVAASLPAAAAAAVPSPDSWKGSTATSYPRVYGSAITLTDGRVVTFGGRDAATTVQPIELRSTAGTWAVQSGDAAIGSAGVQLTDGRVLIVGGWDNGPSNYIRSEAHAYTPTASGLADQVSGSIDMYESREYPAIAALPGGKALVVGGDNEYGMLSSAEVFDGQSNSFQTVADSGVARFDGKAFALANGKVLVAGGWEYYSCTSTDCLYRSVLQTQLYNPTTNTWSSAGNLHAGRSGGTFVKLADGRVLAAGGIDDATGTVAKSAEIYDPAKNTWTTTATMTTARFSHQATLLGNGTVLVAGGYTSGTGCAITAAAELFDPWVGAWTTPAPLPVTLRDGAMTTLADGTALVVGGKSNCDTSAASYLKTTYQYASPSAPTAYPATKYHPIAPGRVLDTRPTGSGNTNSGLSGKLTANTPRTFKVTGVIPTGATKIAVPVGAKAVTGNLTVVGQSAAGSLVLGPVVTSRPSTSTLSFPLGDIRANNVTVALRADGTLAIDFVGPAGATTNAVFDVTGYFLDAASDTTGSTLHTVTPGRVLDSRPTTTGTTNIGLAGKFKNRIARTFQVAGVKPVGGSVALVPSNATAVTGNVTIVNNTSGGYVALGPTMANDPKTSTLNIPVGDIRANGVTVQLSAGKLAAVWAGTTGSTADVIFDVTGYFTADATGSKFYPIDPVRMLDSRVGNGLAGTFANRTPRTLQLGGRGMPTAQQIPTTATGIAGNLTLVNESSKGYAFISPAASSTPTSSTLNVPAGDVRANGFDVALASGGKVGIVWAGTTGSTTHVILDVTGYWK